MTKIKTAIVTGAYGAIGKAIARNIALNKNLKVVIIGRNENKLESTKRDLVKSTDNQLIECAVVDLSMKESIIGFSKNWVGAIDILINNAATTPRQRLVTSQGIEMQWATNVLGYFHMINCLSVHMEMVSDARIVNVASYWAGGLNLDDVEFKHRPYNNDSAYRQSKQVNRMLTWAFSQRLKDKGISVVSCHPGDVNSKLSNNLGFGGHESPDQGASTPVWLATSNEVIGITGKYFEHRKETRCQFSENKDRIERLFDLCSSY